MTTILYVEDEPLLAKIVHETLASSGYEVTLAKNGLEGLQKFRQRGFHLCIFDIMLPDKNGYELAQEIRKMDVSVPIIFLTAKDQTKDVLKGFEVGGNDYLRKPFSMEELIARIENLIKLSPQEKQIQHEYCFNQHIRYTPKLMQIQLTERVLNLSHKENQILQMLCERQNTVVDRNAILHHVWGDNSYYNSRTLDVYIAKLRSIFKEAPDIQIQTLKGVGYKFITQQQ